MPEVFIPTEAQDPDLANIHQWVEQIDESGKSTREQLNALRQEIDQSMLEANPTVERVINLTKDKLNILKSEII